MLEGVNVVLGVCGSIAAVRCVELAHEFRRHGAAVKTVMTPAAESILHPNALEFATENEVVRELTGAIEHVDLCGRDSWGDVLVIAPGTANTLGKMATAVDDTPVTTCATTAIGADLPVVFAPAMHEPMWDHPGVTESMATLRSWGVSFVDPRFEEGKAKIADEEAIVLATARATSEPSLADAHVLITSGPTTEPIDPVRVLTNRSSGRMGRSVASACYVLGADVTLVHDGPSVPYAAVKAVETGAEMREAVLETLPEADAVISAAAIGDFTVDTARDKLDSRCQQQLSLEPAPKLVEAVRDADPSLPLVTFKALPDATDEELTEAATAQMARLDSAFAVANDASVMGESQGRVLIVDRTGTTPVSGSKREIGASIADRLATVVGP